MAEPPVPISMGSPRFTEREVERFLVTRAWFPPGAFLEPHVHDRPTFAVILDGGFGLQFTSPAIRKKDLPCPAGAIFTEPAGERHSNQVSERGASVVVFQPDPDAPSLDAAGLGLLDRINHFRHGRITAIARDLAREVLATDSVAPLAMEALALEMLVEAARLDDDHRRPGDTPPWLLRAVEFIHEHFREPIRLADVARAANVHPSHLAATFRRAHGMPPGTYMRRLRVEWAADELARSVDSISRIAIRAGFADQAHLTRAFKAGKGTTPARFRSRGRASRPKMVSLTAGPRRTMPGPPR